MSTVCFLLLFYDYLQHDKQENVYFPPSVCACRLPASLFLGVTGRYSASCFLLMKENYGCIDKFVTLPFSFLFKKSFFITYSESSSMLTRMQRLKPNRTESLSPSCSQPPGDRHVNRLFQRNLQAVFRRKCVMHEWRALSSDSDSLDLSLSSDFTNCGSGHSRHVSISSPIA